MRVYFLKNKVWITKYFGCGWCNIFLLFPPKVQLFKKTRLCNKKYIGKKKTSQVFFTILSAIVRFFFSYYIFGWKALFFWKLWNSWCKFWMARTILVVLRRVRELCGRGCIIPIPLFDYTRKSSKWNPNTLFYDVWGEGLVWYPKQLRPRSVVMVPLRWARCLWSGHSHGTTELDHRNQRAP